MPSLRFAEKAFGWLAFGDIDMKLIEKLQAFHQSIEKKCFEQFGLFITDMTFPKIIDYMYTPKDSSSLAVTRILFGLAMVFDIPDERGGATMDKRWGDPKMCHFPLLPFIRAIPMPYMALVYTAMWLGAIGIMLGYKYRVAASTFTAYYWYLLLIEKSYWNNHSYLFGLVALLISCTDANCYWSLDAYLNPCKKKNTVPYWNYFILKYQFFILYFMAGMKKGTAEWLSGYSVQNLSEHWVFAPFRVLLTVSQIDYLIVHWFIFIFDLTICFWMMWSYTRNIAMIFCALFHLMNSRLFRIGMFSWVCLATMPLFYQFDWPKTVIGYYQKYALMVKCGICKKLLIGLNSNDLLDHKDTENTDAKIKENQKNLDKINVRNKPIRDGQHQSELNKSDLKTFKRFTTISPMREKRNKIRQKITMCLITLHVLSQAFLPYSHFITKGYNNWTNGLYGYSWDMMVHTWDLHSVIIKVVDNENNIELYIDPNVYAPNDRWTRHGDMVLQYAMCLKDNLLMEDRIPFTSKKMLSKNISIYVDVWCSMNDRFVQRIFDPKTDLLKATWSPFRDALYLMPLLDDGLDWRKDLEAIRKEVHSWDNITNVVFFADFPGYHHDKFIPMELNNVTLAVLKGSVVFEPEVNNLQIGQSYQLSSGNHVAVRSGTFHKVLNIGQKPALYMYTFRNFTKFSDELGNQKSKLPIFQELYKRLAGMFLFVALVIHYIIDILHEIINQCLY